MDSATSKKIAEQERQAEIRRQIALLQSQLKEEPTSADAPVAPQSSTVLQKLAEAHKQKNKAPERETVARSNAFSAKPPPIAPDDRDDGNAAARDETMALIEDIPIGPTDHKPPFDDPHFEKLEPNSNIRLSSRAIPHEDFQDYLRGRYYLSPSKLYSVVRLLPNKQGYDVPVCGDWLTIAVVAERGKMKYTQAPVGISRDDKIQVGDDERMDDLSALDAPAQGQAGPSRPFNQFQKRQKPQGDVGTKPGGKKYVNMKLIDFGCRSRGSSADGGKAKIRGDAFLSLLLFEADACDVVTKDDGTKQKIYRGGSRGAFERMSKLREGAVVALLNPKILKPFQRATDKPHPTDNILALTPESDASIAIIGYALDLGTCRAMKRDGTRCTSWCDKRVSDVCDFHIQMAVERRRAARPELAVGTTGMSVSAKKKPAYDPARQWGLKPETSASSSSTYVVSGHVISGSGADLETMYIGENVGREAQAKAARKLAADSDKALQRLLARDKEGTKAVLSAREFAKRKAEEVKKEKGKGKEGKKVGKSNASASTNASKSGKAKESKLEPTAKQEDDSRMRKNAYSAELIKQLGFDPTAKDGRAPKDAEIQSKLDTLKALHATRKIELGPRPGKKSSCVRQPQPLPQSLSEPRGKPEGSERTDDDDDLEKQEIEAFGRPVGLAEQTMVDLDDSDGD
ncbi:hypothetical protein C8Q76DRAFT_623679 [Earliella scabrosa]|nr:hypothetical protein C8Q76DRAFT_623679 [Earliella scabrosa]